MEEKQKINNSKKTEKQSKIAPHNRLDPLKGECCPF